MPIKFDMIICETAFKSNTLDKTNESGYTDPRILFGKEIYKKTLDISLYDNQREKK